MAKENPEWDDPWKADPYHTGNFIGKKGNEGVAVWNPITNSIEKYTAEEWRKKSLDHRRETGENIAHFYTNKYGEDVYGLRPKETYAGMKGDGESFLIAGPNPNEGNRPTMPDPNNTTPVPISVPNPNYDPDKVVDPFLPPPEGGPNITYPGYGDNSPTGGTNDPWSPPTGGVEDSVFESFQNVFGSPVETDFRTDFRLGEDSPWGNAGVEGGNRDFYRQQLNNLRAQEQGYQEAAIGAAIRRKAAADAPAQPISDPFDWAYGGKGLPTVSVAGGTVDNPTTYALRSYVKPGETSNADILRQYGGFDTGNMERWLAENKQFENQYNWSRANNPEELINTLSRDPAELATSNYDFLSRIYNNMFIEQGIETPEGGGPSAAPGYALPIGVR